ncbi:MAG: hypothetical protein KBF32_10595 [Chitinophagales bacterium]|nr:hypothetical protein [Chitinophagales bacterium]
MKQILTILFLATTTIAYGQTSKQIDSLSFCHNKYKAPTGCKTESEYQLQCNDYSIQWLYMNDEMLKTMPDQFVSQLAGQMKKFKKKPITPLLLEKEVNGYKISFKSDSGTSYQIIAYGIANGQPVLVQLSLDKEPKTNDDIPEFARQIVKLTK